MDAKISSLDNQMIIIRDPYSRFCSAVKYAIENYSNCEKIRKIINDLKLQVNGQKYGVTNHTNIIILLLMKLQIMNIR